jgi:hypothetical protein
MSEINLTQEFDASVWVDEWMKAIKNDRSIATSEGTMLGWFANAIMAGYDKAQAERDILQDKFETLELDYRDVCQKRLEAADSFSKQIIDLTNDRDELKLAVAQTKLDISAWKNICTEWYKDAERFIQLANFNNKKAGEYFELHEQLVEKYGGENNQANVFNGGEV